MMIMTHLMMTTGAMAPLTQTEDPTNPDLSTLALKRDEMRLQGKEEGICIRKGSDLAKEEKRF